MSERSFSRRESVPRRHDGRRSYRSLLAGAALGAASIGATYGVEEYVRRDHVLELAPRLRNEVRDGALRSPFAFREHRDWEVVGGSGSLGGVDLFRELRNNQRPQLVFEIAVRDRSARIDEGTIDQLRVGTVRLAPSVEAARQVFFELRAAERADLVRQPLQGRGVGETPLAAGASACESLLNRVHGLIKTIEVPRRFASRAEESSPRLAQRVIDGRHVSYVDHPIVGEEEVVAESETHDAVFYLQNTHVRIDQVSSRRSDGPVYEAVVTADVIYDTGRRWHHE